ATARSAVTASLSLVSSTHTRGWAFASSCADVPIAMGYEGIGRPRDDRGPCPVASTVMGDQSGAPSPHLRQVVLDSTDARRLAEFYRQLLGFSYRPGDEPPGPERED